MGTITAGLELPFGFANSLLFGTESWHPSSARFLSSTFGIQHGILGSITHGARKVATSYANFVNRPIDHSEFDPSLVASWPGFSGSGAGGQSGPGTGTGSTGAGFQTGTRTGDAGETGTGTRTETGPGTGSGPATGATAGLSRDGPGVSGDVKYIVSPDKLPVDRRQKLVDLVGKLDQKVRRLAENPTPNAQIDSLVDQVKAKIAQLSGGGQPINFYQPMIPQAQTRFKLLNIVPKDGNAIEPNVLRRLVAVVTHKQPEVIAPDYIWYPGVEGNLTLGAGGTLPISRVIFQISGDVPCSIKKATVHFFNANLDPLGVSTGYLTLNKVDLTQDFPLPSFVEAALVRIVITENWGDPYRTCLRGVTLVHA